MALARWFGRFHGYGTLGDAWFDRDEFLELQSRQVTGLVAVEWRFLPRRSLLLQVLMSQGEDNDFGAFSDTPNEITPGWKWERGAAGILEAGLVENFVSFDNSPDFGIHLGFARRF